MQLFRQEVQDQQSAQWLGTVRLARPLSFAVITACACALLACGAAFLLWGEVTRKAHLSGVLVPTEGSINVAVPAGGVVLERRVGEGQQVKAGEVLLVISIEHPSVAGSSTVQNTTEAVAAEIRARQRLLENARHLSERRVAQQKRLTLNKIGDIDAELAHLEETIRIQQRKVELERQGVERLEPLVAEGYSPEAKLEERRAAHLDAMGQLQTLIRSRGTLTRERRALLGELDNLAAQLQSEGNAMDAQSSTLKQDALEANARRTVAVLAPRAGTVSGIEIRRGQAVQSGQTVLTVLPDTRAGKALEAQLFAPSRAVGFVQPGQEVYVRYAAYPYQKFGMFAGRIRSISASPFSPNELPPNLAQQVLTQAGSVEGLFRISVDLEDQTVHAYGRALPLRPGFVLEADVVQARMKLWELIFEPLLAIRQNLALTGAKVGAGATSRSWTEDEGHDK